MLVLTVAPIVIVDELGVGRVAVEQNVVDVVVKSVQVVHVVSEIFVVRRELVGERGQIGLGQVFATNGSGCFLVSVA